MQRPPIYAFSDIFGPDLTHHVVAFCVGIMHLPFCHRRKFGQVWGSTAPLPDLRLSQCNPWAIGWSQEKYFLGVLYVLQSQQLPWRCWHNRRRAQHGLFMPSGSHAYYFRLPSLCSWALLTGLNFSSTFLHYLIAQGIGQFVIKILRKKIKGIAWYWESWSDFVAVGSWVSILWGVKIRYLPLTWPVAVNTVLALPRSLWYLRTIIFSTNLDKIEVIEIGSEVWRFFWLCNFGNRCYDSLLPCNMLFIKLPQILSTTMSTVKRKQKY